MDEKFQYEKLLWWFLGQIKENLSASASAVAEQAQGVSTGISSEPCSNNILVVNDTFSTILEQIEQSKLLLVYKLFFDLIFKLFKGSVYRKILIKNGWKGEFSYSDFSAPWLKQYISFLSVSLHVNLKQVIGVLNAKEWCNKMGHKRAAILLAVFYERRNIQGIFLSLIHI